MRVSNLLRVGNCWRHSLAVKRVALHPSGGACAASPTTVLFNLIGANAWHIQHHSSEAKRPRRSQQRRLRALSQDTAADTNLDLSNTDQPEITLPTARPAKAKGPNKKQRLDAVCLELRPELSRNLIQSWILQGKVTVDGKIVSKAGAPVSATSKVAMTAEEPKYVCRAGHKLEAALDHFSVDPAGLICLDSGQSTGGFSDCLLQRGAAHIYGIDVGYGQVADKVRRDPRVTVMERFNVRHLKPKDIPTQVHLATLDLAFISVLKVVPAVVSVLVPPPDGQLLVLIKPQFEAGRAQVSTGGVVRDPAVHRDVVKRVTEGINALGFVCRGVIESPLKGDKSGNTEFLAHFVRDPTRVVDALTLAQLAQAAAGPAADEGEEEQGQAGIDGGGDRGAEGQAGQQ